MKTRKFESVEQYVQICENNTGLDIKIIDKKNINDRKIVTAVGDDDDNGSLKKICGGAISFCVDTTKEGRIYVAAVANDLYEKDNELASALLAHEEGHLIHGHIDKLINEQIAYVKVDGVAVIDDLMAEVQADSHVIKCCTKDAVNKFIAYLEAYLGIDDTTKSKDMSIRTAALRRQLSAKYA